MSLSVTVALVASEGVASSHAAHPRDFGAPYGERRNVTLEVDESETVDEVLHRGAHALGVEYSPLSIAFYRPEDERELTLSTSWSLPVLDVEGRVTWRGFLDVRYGDLVRAAEAGAVNGDPLRPYLINGPQVGDGMLPTWQAFLEMWDVLVVVLQSMATAGGAAQFVKMMRDLLRRGEEAKQVLDEHAGRWDQTGADPFTFDAWLDEKPWHPTDLADLLGCTAGEAEAVLWAFGFAAAPSGVWRRRETEEAKLLAGNREITITVGFDRATQEQLSKEFGKRVGHYANTGQAPPPPRLHELDWLKPPVWTRPLVAVEEERGLVGRLVRAVRRLRR